MKNSKSTRLPEQFIFSHNYCFYLHDQMLETLISGEKAEIFNIEFKHRSLEEAEEIRGLQGADFIDWMLNHGYVNEVHQLYFQQCAAALLSDLLHFTYEALESSRKGKLTVSCALLRKPFKDNLLILEWMLADRADFIERFIGTKPHRFAIPSSLSKQKRVEIIEKAMKLTRGGNWISAEFIHEVRYEKSCPYGMEQLWQKANHLFTTQTPLETEPSNINFIFSNEESKQIQWEHLYRMLPMLLYCTVQVVEALILSFAKRKDEEKDLTSARTDLGLLIWMEKEATIPALSDLKKVILASFDIRENHCDNCKKAIAISIENLETFCIDGHFKCNHCGHPVKVERRS